MDQIQLQDHQKSMLKTLVRTETYKALQSLASLMIVNWTKQIPSRDSEFKFIYENAERDGKIQGVDLLLKELERIQ